MSIDRLVHLRKHSSWFEQLKQNYEVEVLIMLGSDHIVSDNAIALSLDNMAEDVSLDRLYLLGAQGNRAFVALDRGSEHVLQDVKDFRDFFRVAVQLDSFDLALLVYARALILWSRTAKFCGVCGSETVLRAAGHERHCSNADCAHIIFPRINPAMIVLVEHEGKALLGRESRWPSGRYSTIAGFVEPGENLEATVRREVMEETQIRVGKVSYWASQPWPVPSSLMLGFTAHAETSEINCTDDELEDAQWFSRAQLKEKLLAGTITVPFPRSISFKLIEQWYDREGDALKALL